MMGHYCSRRSDKRGHGDSSAPITDRQSAPRPGRARASCVPDCKAPVTAREPVVAGPGAEERPGNSGRGCRDSLTAAIMRPPPTPKRIAYRLGPLGPVAVHRAAAGRPTAAVIASLVVMAPTAGGPRGGSRRAVITRDADDEPPPNPPPPYCSCISQLPHVGPWVRRAGMLGG
jgi:hypothetical protein